MGKIEVSLTGIRSAQLTQNHNQIGYAWYPWRAVAWFPVERSSEVTLWRHRVTVRFLPITSDRNERLVPQCSPRQGASIDMQHDLLRSHCDLDLALPEVKFSNWPFKNKKNMDRSGLTARGTRLCQNHSPSFSSLEVIHEKNISQKAYFFPFCYLSYLQY